MNQTSVLLTNQLVKATDVPKNNLLSISKKTEDKPFQTILQTEKGLAQKEETEIPLNENQDESVELSDTLSFLDKEGLEEIDEAFELLNLLITTNQEDISNLEFIKRLLGSNPSETIIEALDQLMGDQSTMKQMDFTKLPPSNEDIEALNGILNKGLANSFEGLTGEKQQAFLTLLNVGKLIVMSNEHILPNQKVAENVSELTVLLSKWKDKLSSMHEKVQEVPAVTKNSTGSMRDIGMKAYNQQAGQFPLNIKNGGNLMTSNPITSKNPDIPLNQPVMIGELQLQIQQQSPTLALEKNGQAVGTDEFIKSFEAILSRANYTNQNGVQRLFIRLTPENLGTLQIELMQKDGQMVARIIANTQSGKELLESQIQGLRVSLASQGIHFDKIEFEQKADAQHQEEPPSDKRRDHQNENLAEDHFDDIEEETHSGFLSVLEDSMINQEI